MITKQDAQDAQDYPYIVGYCRYLWLPKPYVAEQVRIARRGEAPRTTISVWVEPVQGRIRARTIEALSPGFRERLEHYMAHQGLETSTPTPA